MTLEDLECWQQARQLTFGLTYVIEDNYPTLAADAVELRKRAIGTGQLMGGLMRSTESRKSKMLTALSALCHLLSPV